MVGWALDQKAPSSTAAARRAGGGGTLLYAVRNLFTNPNRLPLIAPSMLAADFARMGEECRQVLSPLGEGGAAADLLHVDVMDGHFVPNLTMGPDMVRGVRRLLPKAFLDVHLMVEHPMRFAEAFVDAGANHLTVHAEVAGRDGTPSLREMAERIRELGVTAGVAINPDFPGERVIDELEVFDLVLVMSVFPGRGGQKFIADVLSKVEMLSERLTPNQRLEMDGGINRETAGACLDAGCDVLVAGTSVFGESPTRRAAAVQALRGDD